MVTFSRTFSVLSGRADGGAADRLLRSALGMITTLAPERPPATPLCAPRSVTIQKTPPTGEGGRGDESIPGGSESGGAGFFAEATAQQAKACDRQSEDGESTGFRRAPGGA